MNLLVGIESKTLGLRLRSTENAVVCTELLQQLLERGLTITGRVLYVIDSGKGLRRPLQDVLGAAAVIHRCELHKARNPQAVVPKTRQAHAGRPCGLRIARPAPPPGAASSTP